MQDKDGPIKKIYIKFIIFSVSINYHLSGLALQKVVAETGKIDVDILGQGPSAETRALNFEIQKYRMS